MFGKNVAAKTDRGLETAGRVAVLHSQGQRLYRVAPDGLVNLAVDALIGDDLDLVIGQGREDQNARPVLGGVKAVSEELFHGGAAHPGSANAARGHKATNAWDLRPMISLCVTRSRTA